MNLLALVTIRFWETRITLPESGPFIGWYRFIISLYHFFILIYIYIYIHTHTHTHTCRVQLELANKDAFMLEVQFSILGGGYIWHVE